MVPECKYFGSTCTYFCGRLLLILSVPASCQQCRRVGGVRRGHIWIDCGAFFCELSFDVKYTQLFIRTKCVLHFVVEFLR